MPRTVDHEQRRSMILKAFRRVAVRDGLHAVSLRAVAQEAGVSLRLVQYYFETKAGLMGAGLRMLEDASKERWSDRLAQGPQPPTAPARLRALFSEALPSDTESRDFHFLWMSYAVLAMTDETIGESAFVDGPDRLQRRIAAILREGQATGTLQEDLDAEAEAAILLAMLHGFGTAVLVGQQTADAAIACLEHHLARLAAI